VNDAMIYATNSISMLTWRSKYCVSNDMVF